jgi:hypothetical protein
MTNPEQHVIDEIDRLVDWQIEEGRKRGDDPPEFNVSFRIPTREELEEFRAHMERLRRARAVVVPPDAPYQEWREFEPGERVGWQLSDGTVRVGVVEEHREDPPGSGNWTMTIT